MDQMNSFYGEYYDRQIKPNKVCEFYHRNLFRIISKRIPGFSDLSILEIGAGFGYLAKICKEKDIAYQGIEGNPAQSEHLKKSGYDVICDFIPPLPETRPCDVIYLSFVLEHADGWKSARELMLAINERLKAGKHIVIICPDVKDYKMHFWDCDWSHGYPTSLKRVKQLMTETGYEVSFGRHFTGGFINPLMVFLLTGLFKLIPVRILDYFSEKIAGTPLAYRFMVSFGWRQIILIGRKSASATSPSPLFPAGSPSAGPARVKS